MNILNKLTKNYLKLNKKRTIVTIIGIILSGAMITAVATLAVSFKAFMLDVEIQNSGAWEANFKNVETKDIAKIEDNDNFEKTMIMVPVGMAQNSYSDDKFIYIKEYDKEALENMKIKLIEGRLPENNTEIVLSESFFDGKENEPKIGDTITLNIGKRMLDNYELISQEYTEKEQFVKTGERTYTICGKIRKPDFETYNDNYTSGVSLLDETKEITATNVDIGVIDKNANNIYKDTEKIADELGLYEDGNGERIYNIKYNTYVLAYKGVNDTSGFTSMLYSVCAILILVIAIGSILVIYNSFAISVSERKKQFGMLASVGATKKQIKKSVIYEGAILGLIGIPIGVLSGIGGIGITLGIVNNLLKPMLNTPNANWNLELVVSWPAIVIAVVLISITIYLSVIIPAKQASKITPIDAIRQKDDIKIKAKKLKTPKFIMKLFGIEGEMALKNLKRSKKRYRTTVISLIISIVLFISVSGFVDYMFSGFDSVYKTVNYDYSISLSKSEELEEKNKALESKIQSLDSIERISKIEQVYGNTKITQDRLDNKVVEKINNNDSIKNMFAEDENGYILNVSMVSLDEKEFNRYLKEVGLDELGDNQIILVNYIDLLMGGKYKGYLTNYKEKDKINVNMYNSETEKLETKTLEIAKVTEKVPFGVEIPSYPQLIAVTSKNFMNNVDDNYKYYNIYIKSKNDEALKASLSEIENEIGESNINIENVKEIVEQQRNLKLIINIFLYGFITLISLIGIANIFNTISTNINLRRREFAMLKSIGMTDKAFKRMLNLECIFYGTKALLFGVPIGVGICYLINRGFGNLIEFAFNLPWGAILISIIAVYIVVFITMIYSSGKIKKENIIDVLRDENI